MTEIDHNDDLLKSIDEDAHSKLELSFLFGKETVELAAQIDSADLNLEDDIIKSIADGVARLKKLKGDTKAQLEFITGLQQGSRLLLCLWILDMDLLKKIQNRSYLDESGTTQSQT